MVKNLIQEQRMKKYFLDATKEILIGEGVTALSVRNVAKRAGYSYATLYNYFEGIPDLISYSILDFQEECKNHIQHQTKTIESGKGKLKSIIIAYVDYLIQYPSLFNLFYLERLSSSKANQSSVLFLEKLYRDDLDICVSTLIIKKEDADNLPQTINCLISGILLLYLNRSYPKEYIDFKNQLNTQLDLILAI